MNDLHPDLRDIIEAIEILSPVGYVFKGEPRDVPASTDPLAEPGGSLIADLESNIYSRLYIRPTALSAADSSGRLARRDFLAALSAANSGKGSFESGWQIHKLGSSDVELSILGSRGLKFWVSSAEFDRQIDSIETCTVRVPRELRYLVPGFYYVTGEAWDGPSNDEEPIEREILLRFYWHLTSAGAEPFVTSATSALNEARIPFHLKVLREPEAYSRADAGVLYVGRRYLGPVSDVIKTIYAKVARDLRPDVPLFTRKLDDGLAIAEDPADSVSFGQHRCRLVARGLWQSYTQGDADTWNRANMLATVFRSEGLDPLHPYLGAGSSMDHLDLARLARPVRSVPLTTPRRPLCNSPLEAAVKIGEALCRSAHWDRSGGLCNWIGRSFAAGRPYHGPEPIFGTLSPGVYLGSAGVALFLAQLNKFTGHDVCRRTAVGAMYRSIRQASLRPADLALSYSYYSGLLGVAIAAESVGLLVGDDQLALQAEPLLDSLPADGTGPHLLDFLGGHAGAIPALLAFSRSTGLSGALDLAIALGDELCELASRDGAIWTWEPVLASGPGFGSRPLTGMSHGASGIALGLLELHAETGRPRYLEAATAAFAYEDVVFDAEHGNWPDFREGINPDDQAAAPEFLLAWCHGAPGIALARLRACSIDVARAEHHRSIAQVAVSTTLRAIDLMLDEANYDISLCHGLTGLLEIAMVAGRLLDDPACRERVDLITDRLIQGLDNLMNRQRSEPNPSLMLGLAGVGYTMLRIHDSARVPSVLLID